MPIGVAFLEEEFDPWTESVHRFRYYAPPRIIQADPDEIEVGKMAEVFVFADENSEFWERKSIFIKINNLYSHTNWKERSRPIWY